MERKRVVAGIRALQFVRAEKNIAPFSSMKEQVLEACELKQGGKAWYCQKENRKSRQGFIWRAALAGACLLIAVSVYSALAPVPTSTANSFLRRAQIWAGGILKTNAVVAPPEKKGALPEAAPGSSKDTIALKEAHDTYGLAVLSPTKLPAGMTLGEIEISGADEFLSKIHYTYKNQNDTLDFTIMEIADQMGTAIFVETIEYPTPVGTFIVWGNDTGWNAVAICGNSQVNIQGTMDKDTFLHILDGLLEVN
jgi:hypothetical protein